MQYIGTTKAAVQTMHRRNLVSCTTLFFLGSLLVAFLLLPAYADQRKVAIIHIDHRLATEAVPVVQGLLSPEGTATADTRTNSLVIVDTPQSIQRIRDFLQGFDYPVEQVRVRVRFNDNRSRDHRSVTAEGKISGNDWGVGTGDREDEGTPSSGDGLEIGIGDNDDGVTVRLEGARKEKRGVSDYFINVSSGSTAYIVAGTSIPYEQAWINLCRKHGHVIETVEFRDVETGFDVSPVIVGDQAHIEITPRLSYQSPEDGDGVIRFTEASTFVTVLLNQWVSIGGAIDDDNEVAREILGYSSGGRGADFGISVMVEKK